jgi:hypothetical protein
MSLIRYIAACVLALSLAPARAQAPSVDVLTGSIQVAGAEPLVVRFGFDGSAGVKAYTFATENRPGLSALVGAHGVTPGAGGRAGLTLIFFLHIYVDGGYFLEGQILNDTMKDPAGLVDAEWQLEFRGEVISSGKGPIHDQCGVGFHAGTPRYAPRLDLWTQYTVGLPDPRNVQGVPRASAEKPTDPDPNHNTHAAGSPRNRYVAVEAAQYYFTDDQRYLDRLMDFVDAQARRPYHLGEADGTPFRHALYPEAWFIEGRPELKPYRETFGRISLTEPQRAAPPQNGWDHEHMNVEELYAAYVLFGSRIARRELLLIAEQLMSTNYVRTEGYTQHSGRAFGWVARMLVRAHRASGEDRYIDAVRRMLASLRKNAVMDGAYRGLVPQAPKGDHMKDERWESPFMVAIAASAIALYLEAEPEDEGARELLRFCGDLLVDQGYSPTNGGFYYDYAVDSGNKGGDGTATNGVVLFIPSALVEVAAEMPEEARAKYLEPARRVLEAQRKEPWASPSHPDAHFHKWMLRAVREFQ